MRRAGGGAPAQAALTAQRRFVGDASHELRTPLTAIRGNAELLQRVPHMALEDRQQSIAEIVSESQRMSRLVGDLLELARADAGHHLRKEPGRPRPAGPRMLCRGALPAGRLRLALERAPAHRHRGGRCGLLKQLLLILLDNACKYTPAGGRVDIGATALRDNRVAIAVKDTGLRHCVRGPAAHLRPLLPRGPGAGGRRHGARPVHRRLDRERAWRADPGRKACPAPARSSP